MPDEPPSRGRLSAAIEALPPGYFALVMATGIVSLAAQFVGMKVVPTALFWINVAAYSVLCALTLARLARHPRRVADDLGDHARGPGFFTLPAGTCVLGAQFAILRESPSIAAGLWIAALVLWALVSYGFFASVTIKAEKPALSEGLNGTWLVSVVSMQALAVLGCVTASSFSEPSLVLFVATAMHMGGFMLYLPLIALLLYRWTFVAFTPFQLTPPYWINMGALAISTLAGARLLQSAGISPLLQRLTPFLQGSTFFAWSAATWWIPLLVVLGVWRHGFRRVPFRYDPQYWGLVFPLGMYTACTVQLSRALEVPQLEDLARVFVWPALLAWGATAIGMSSSLVRAARRDR